MRILLQQIETKLFLKGENEWVSDARDAREFPTALNAFFIAMGMGIVNTEIVEAPSHGEGAITPIAAVAAKSMRSRFREHMMPESGRVCSL